MKNKICFQLLIILYILTSINGCKKDEDKNQPSEEKTTVVTTISLASMTTTSVICGGIVTDDDSLSIIERGVCYSTSQNPTIVNTKLLSVGQNGKFDCNLTELTVNGTYYVKAYTKKNSGTTYGNEIKFTTDPLNVSDNDGNTYNVIRIGTQLWMKENLKTTKYQDGTKLPYITNNTIWFNQTSGAYCFYGHSDYYYNIYGSLYNYYAVTDRRNLCPIGWHIPSLEEWNILVNYLGGDDEAGVKLQDMNGFAALPGGFILKNFNNNDFFGRGSWSSWWSSTWVDGIDSYDFSVIFYLSSSGTGKSPKSSGSYVRCIRD